MDARHVSLRQPSLPRLADVNRVTGMASSFGDRLAWGAAQTGEKAASGLWRVSRRTVGSACVRVAWAREGHGKEVLALFLDELDGADGGEARALPDRWLSRACR